MGKEKSYAFIESIGLGDRTPKLQYNKDEKNEILQEIKVDMRLNYKKHKECLEDYMSLVMLRKHKIQMKRLEI